MNGPTPTGLDALVCLVHLVRFRLWRAEVQRLLGPVLWATAATLAAGALLHWRYGVPGPITLSFAAALPAAVALGLAMRRRPTAAGAARVADRRVQANHLLLTAWHLAAKDGGHVGRARRKPLLRFRHVGDPSPPGAIPDKDARDGGHAANARATSARASPRPALCGSPPGAAVVLARAARALPTWAADPRLHPMGPSPWPGVLACLAALPLLALEGPTRPAAQRPVLPDAPQAGREQASPAPAPAPEPRSPLDLAIAALAPDQTATDRPRGSGNETGGDPRRREGAAGAPMTEPGQGSAQGGEPGAPAGAGPTLATAADRSQPGPTPAPPAGPGIGGQEGAGGGPLPRRPGQAGEVLHAGPDLILAERQVALARSGDTHQVGSAAGFPLTGSSAPPASTTIAPAPPARVPDPAALADPAFTPAQRALIFRYLSSRQETPAQ